MKYLIIFRFIINFPFMHSYYDHVVVSIRRNNSHLSVLAYREKTFLDNHKDNESELWYDDYYKDYYRYNSERIHHEVYNFTKQSVSDDHHKIRILVNSDDNQAHNGRIGTHFDGNTDEYSSGASVSIVEIDDPNKFTEKNIEQLIPAIHQFNYTEKAIDVPEEFERRAYDIANRNELSPFVRNLQPSTQVYMVYGISFAH